MLIQMTDTRLGSNDGFTCIRFHKGESYDTGKNIGHSLACEFVNRGYATVAYKPSLEDTMVELTALLEAGRA